MRKSSPSHMTAARRRAEMTLGQKQGRQERFRADQERERQAMTEKTVRLRDLRLAKEAADKEEADKKTVAAQASKSKKQRRF
jgi:hypothetical protein